MGQKFNFENFDKSSFELIEWNDLIKEIGSKLLEDRILPLLKRSVEVMDVDEGLMIAVKNKADNSYSVYDQTTGILVIAILKNKKGEYFCTPNLLTNFYYYQATYDIEDELQDYEICKPIEKELIIDTLYELNQLPENEKLHDFLYHLSVVLLYEYNLDLINSNVMYFDIDSILLDGIKSEIIYSQGTELITQEVTYMIYLDLNSEKVRIEKVFENNIKRTYHFDIVNFLLEIE